MAGFNEDKIREEFRAMFRHVIGDDLRGDVEKFVVLDRRHKGDCAVVETTTGDVHAISFVEDASCDANEQSVSKTPKYVHLRSRKLRNICGLGVKDISHGGDFHSEFQHILLTAGNGRLFSWGRNRYGQLGVATCDNSPIPLMIDGPLGHQEVVKVACGDEFSVCLTANGQVWAWGYNSAGMLGNGNTNYSDIPQRIGGALEDVHIASVSCGEHFVLALTDEGRPWSWGSNDKGQLGHSSSGDDVLTPKKVNLPPIVVVKNVACGTNHSLAVTSNGHLYAWGCNEFGQLGFATGEEKFSRTPLRINFALGLTSINRSNCTLTPAELKCSCEGSSSPCPHHFVCDVAAYYGLDLSAAKTTSGEVYVWGECNGGGNRVTVPFVTTCGDLDEVFLSLSAPSMTFRPMLMDPAAGSCKKRSSIHSCLQESFDDQNTADVKFVAEGKPIHVHKAFLRIRSEHFRRMFAKGASWAETEADTINITEFSFPVYRAFLLYLYTETLMEGLSPDDLMGLLDLAQSYCEDDLRALCVAWISATITCDSAATFYAGAIRFAAKDVEDFCCDFMIQHLTEITMSGAFEGFGEKLILGFFQKAAQSKAFCF